MTLRLVAKYYISEMDLGLNLQYTKGAGKIILKGYPRLGA
jgi:hypothetical protein